MNIQVHPLARPTDAEMEILVVLWTTGPATVRQVYEFISQRRHAQYSTILKFMQIMATKGLLLRNEEQRAHVYKPARPPEWTRQQLVGHLLDHAFNGSVKALLVAALSTKKIKKSGLAELHRVVDEYAAERPKRL